jgi:hypothetical protein
MTGVRHFSERTRPTDAVSESGSRARWGGGGCGLFRLLQDQKRHPWILMDHIKNRHGRRFRVHLSSVCVLVSTPRH